MFSLQALVEASPDAAAQLVAAYADPDPWIAFAAIQFPATSLEPITARAHLLQAGAARALVAALSHDSPDCRGAAAYATLTASDLEVLSALRAAGLVPAMMELIRRGPASSPSPPPSQSRPGLGFFSNSKVTIKGRKGSHHGCAHGGRSPHRLQCP
jgi:HEAT repeat protein